MTKRSLRRTVCVLLALIATDARMSVAPADPTASAADGKPLPSIPSRDAAREQMALKIAGLVVFVANSCPGLRPDYSRFKAIIADLGMSEQTLAQPEIKSRYLAYTARYQADASTSCQRAIVQFGPKGSTLPALFAAP